MEEMGRLGPGLFFLSWLLAQHAHSADFLAENPITQVQWGLASFLLFLLVVFANVKAGIWFLRGG
jgi:hypothetical protein